MADEPGPGHSAPPGWGGMADVARESLRVHGRNVEMAQDWAQGALVTLKDQAESYGRLLRSVDASLKAMEQAVESQAQATRAMAQHLEASRAVIDSALAAHRQTVERVETHLTGVLGVLDSQLQALRRQMEMGQRAFADPVSAQSAMFLQLTRDWAEAYRRLSDAAPFASRADS